MRTSEIFLLLAVGISAIAGVQIFAKNDARTWSNPTTGKQPKIDYDSYYDVANIKWGEPARINENFGKLFSVSRTVASDQSLSFPLTLSRAGGSVSYRSQFELRPASLRFITYCTYRGDDHVVMELRSQVDAQGKQLPNGYVIYKSAETDTGKDGKPCGAEIRPAKYVLMTDNSSWRLYTDPEDYLELVPVD